MNLAGLASLSRYNTQRKYGASPGSASFGYLSRQTGGGGVNAGNQYPGTYGGYGTGLLPGGRIRASPSQSGQPRSLYGVDFPVVGYPDTGWDPGQPSTNQNIIPGAGDIRGEPTVITTQNIPPSDASRLPMNSFYLNPQEFGGGPNAPTYGTAGMYPLPDMNIPPNEDVSPMPANTFLGDYNPNVGRRYPDLSSLPPVVPTGYESSGYMGGEVPGNVNRPGQNYQGYQPPIARAVARRRGFLGGFFGTGGNYDYPVPGVGGFPSTYGGGQSWQSNASRGGQGIGSTFWGGLSQGLGSLFGGARGASFSGGKVVSNFPEYSGFGGPVGRSSAGPLQP